MGIQRLKAAILALDTARAEHRKRVADAISRMDKKNDTLGQATAFVGLGASREVVELATFELEAAAREVAEGGA